jgi:hypothetical protein
MAIRADGRSVSETVQRRSDRYSWLW